MNEHTRARTVIQQRVHVETWLGDKSNVKDERTEDQRLF